MTARVHLIQTQYFVSTVTVHGTCVREGSADGETVQLGNCEVELKFDRAAYEAMTAQAVREAVVAKLQQKAADPKANEGVKKFAGLTIS